MHIQLGSFSGFLIKFEDSDEKFLTAVVIPLDFGTDENMARFALTSNKI
jgi:hypothetical protein